MDFKKRHRGARHALWARYSLARHASRGHNDLKQTFAIVIAEFPHCEVRRAGNSARNGDSLQQAVVIRASPINAPTAFWTRMNLNS
ncbi:hypothetical protein OKW41_005935 [Paraburkholderia sp. UCT70]|uniref:type II toxin-antitoxin system HigB family toxin n=1 Tax=Paraburkholderia sp. UCT70 TaxID=2991068 RepID=UPI003D22B420